MVILIIQIVVMSRPGNGDIDYTNSSNVKARKW